MKNLDEIRSEIDNINIEIEKLLEKRLILSEEVIKYKLKNNLPVFDSSREQIVLNKISNLADDNFKNEIRGTFESIMNMSKLHQYMFKSENSSELKRILSTALEDEDKHTNKNAKIKVGCQGIDGSYTSIAARKIFKDANLSFYENWNDIFIATENNKIDYGVVPIENSTAGSVNDVYKLIMEYDSYITHAIAIPVEHCLLGVNGSEISQIKKIYSHPQAIAQCKTYLDKLTDVELIPYSNTATAAKMISEKADISSATISPKICANIYNLCVLDERIQTISDNTTRFVAISNKLVTPEEANKISIQFSLVDQKGMLNRILAYFSALGLNLTKIQSYPIENILFEYKFYLDFIGSIRDTATFNLICALAEDLKDFKFIGNYYE